MLLAVVRLKGSFFITYYEQSSNGLIELDLAVVAGIFSSKGLLFVFTASPSSLSSSKGLLVADTGTAVAVGTVEGDWKEEALSAADGMPSSDSSSKGL